MIRTALLIVAAAAVVGHLDEVLAHRHCICYEED